MSERYRPWQDRADAVICGDCSTPSTYCVVDRDEIEEHNAWHLDVAMGTGRIVRTAVRDHGEELRERVLGTFEVSEERLAELESAAKPNRDAIMRESIRNSLLRELLGKDDREDNE